MDVVVCETDGEKAVPGAVRDGIKIIFLAGWYFQIGQIIIFREIMALSHGTEQLWGATLAFWLLGAAFGVRSAGQFQSNRVFSSSCLMVWPLLAAGPAMVGLVIGLRLLAWMGQVHAGQMMSISRGLLVAALGTIPLAWLSGRQFSLLLNWTGPNSLGRLYRAEAWGAMFGGLLTGWVLEWFGQIFPLMLVSSIVIILLTLLLFPLPIGRLNLIGLLLTVAFWSLVMSVIGSHLDTWSEEFKWRKLYHGYQQKEVIDTRYGRLVRLDSPNQSIVLQNGSLIGSIDLNPPANREWSPEILSETRSWTDFSPRAYLPYIKEPTGQCPEPLTIQTWSVLQTRTRGRRHWQPDLPAERCSQELRASLPGGGEFRIDQLAREDQEVRALAAFICSQHPSPRRVLLVGGTLGKLPAAFLEHGLSSLELMELDPAIFSLRTQMGLAVDSRMILRIGDARALIKESPTLNWELAVFILPEPDNLTVNRYLTVEFFREVRRALTSNGVLVLLLPSAGTGPEYLGWELAHRTASIWAALKRVFKETRAAPLAGHLLAASDAPRQITFDPEILAARLERRQWAGFFDLIQVENQVLRQPWESSRYPVYFEGLFGGVLAKADSWLESGLHQPMVEMFEKTLAQTESRVNRDDQPAAIIYGLRIFDQLSRADPSGSGWSMNLMEILLESTSVFVMILCFGVGLVLISLVRKTVRARSITQQVHRAKGYWSVGLEAFCSGWATMTVLIATLFIYQNLRGFVYAHIGFLTALFMAGLALGSLGADQWLSNPRRKLIGAFALMAGVAGLWPGLQFVGVHTDQTSLIPLMALLAIGLANGAIYPWLNCLAGATPKGTTLIYGAELTGAATASLITGPFLIPILGVSQVLQLAVVFPLLAMLSVSPEKDTHHMSKTA